MPKKERKARVTKEEVKILREKEKKERKLSNYKRKKKVIPGPWTNIDPPMKVNVKLREGQSVTGETLLGSYPNPKFYGPIQKGWYYILVNLTSKSMKRDIEEHGLDNYIAACEKELIEQEKMGTVVIMDVVLDKSLNEDRSERFISCLAKTNKKNIPKFAAVRGNVYQVLK